MDDYDPRIVDLYDGDNPDGPDHDYYRWLAEQNDARSILDLGCGTGILTVTFAAAGRTVVGLDPSSSMLAYARRRPGADQVTWIQGDTRALTEGAFDLMVMTGNVAQHIADPEWTRTLADLRRVSNDGGVLAFESRNPAVRVWEGWDQPEPTTRQTMHGPLQEWCEATEHDDGQVQMRFHNYFEATDDYVLETLQLIFRDHNAIVEDLQLAGFDVTAVWGDWHRTVFDGTQPIMVFEARAA